MARRTIKSVKFGRCAVTIAKDSYAGEYVVVTKVNGRVVGGKDGGYFTDDKRDARATAAATIKQLRRARSC